MERDYSKLQQKIDFITEITCFDHYKTRDMSYCVEAVFNAHSNKVEYYPYHNGYIWDTDKYRFHTKEFNSFDEAVGALEKAIEQQVEEEFEWFEREFNDPSESWWGNPLDLSPIRTLEDLEEYRERWKEILK